MFHVVDMLYSDMLTVTLDFLRTRGRPEERDAGSGRGARKCSREKLVHMCSDDDRRRSCGYIRKFFVS